MAAQVIEGDVNEAIRLMNMSKISLEDEEYQEQVQQDPVREAFSKVRRAGMLCRSANRVLTQTRFSVNTPETGAGVRLSSISTPAMELCFEVMRICVGRSCRARRACAGA